MNGIANTLPAIKKISFEKKGMMDLNLRDGRIVSIPTRYFPKIRASPYSLLFLFCFRS